MQQPSRFSTTTGKRSLSPLKMTAEKMQMLRRDVKPGNGTSLMTYNNHANLRKHLIEMRPQVDVRVSASYDQNRQALNERFSQTRNRQMDNLRKENNRLFGRLLSIYEVSEIFVTHQSSFLFQIAEKSALCP